MAQKIDVRLVDDVDGETPAERTVPFSFDGVAYEIDLSSDNIAAFAEDIGRWVGHARRATRAQRPPAARRQQTAPPRRRNAATGDVRAWARENGYTVSDRGRIPANVVAAYEAAH